MMSKKERLFGLDLLKILATFTVLSVHFFLNTQFYNTNATGFSITIQVIIRNLCMICIPLFVMLSGYLNNKKDYNKKFFIELLEIIVIWLFYSIIEFITTSIMNNNLSTFNIKTMLYKISIFTACRYSWYIEMFIGLYMMTPILNRAYDSFDDKSKKIVTFLALLLTIGFSFLNGVFSNIIHFPLYWGNLYFIAYYLVGKNIAYFKPDLKS